MIGNLRTRLGLYVPLIAADDLGGTTTQWVFEKAIWAAVKPKTSTERSENGRLAVTQSYLVVIHFQDSFPERARLMWGTRILRVMAASDPDNRRERLHLICEEEQQ
jgi:SPP1 family predicted phage head-tail adaptor